MDAYSTYEELWKERKSFLLSSALIGAIIAIVIMTLLTIGNTSEISLEVIGVYILGVIIFFILFSNLVAVGRLVFFNSAVAGNLITNFMNGFWTTIISTVTGGWLGMVFGMLMFVVFFFVFLFVVVGYAIYLPISSIYLYVMYKKEIAE